MTDEYWHGTVLCHRKGMCHISHEQCLEIHDLSLCGNCDHFCRILERQELEELNEIEQYDQRKALAPVRKRRGK